MIGGEQPQLAAPHGDAGLLWLLDHRKQWGLAVSELACLLGVCTDTLLGWTSPPVATLYGSSEACIIFIW